MVGNQNLVGFVSSIYGGVKMAKEYIGEKQKYVMDSTSDDFFIFPLTINHCDVRFNCDTAGFVRFYITKEENGNIKFGADCFGKSESLHLFANENRDSEVITKSLNRMY